MYGLNMLTCEDGMMTGCNDDLKTAPRKTAVSALPAVDAGCMKMVNDLPREGGGCIDTAVFRSGKNGGGVGEEGGGWGGDANGVGGK